MHAERYFKPSRESKIPSPLSQQRILYECERAYSRCVWLLRDDFDSRAAFDDAVRRLDMTSSPGWPYQREATTNGQWLKWNGVECDGFQLDSLWHDVQLVLTDQWEHIVRVFIKQEPHKKRKVAENRWRLIMASSLCVQVAWHMLFSALNDIEIDKAYYIPSQQGIVLVGGGWRQFHQSWTHLGTIHGMDKSAWDWTAPYWALKLDLQLRYRLGRGPRMKEWLGKAELLYRHMFEEPVLMTSAGYCFRQVVPGIMKSGCVNTISTNSHCQVFIHMAVCFETGLPIHPLPRVCGDDTLHHSRHVQDLEPYRLYGMQLKSISDTVEFVGHEFHSSGPRPMYLLKHLKKLLYVPEENLEQYLDSMARMYVHTDYFDMWEAIARRLGFVFPLSRHAYLHWYDVKD